MSPSTRADQLVPPSSPFTSGDNDNDNHNARPPGSRASSVLSDPPSSPITSPNDNLPMLRSRSNRQAVTAVLETEDEGEDDVVAAVLEGDGEEEGEASDDSFSLASGRKRKASAKKGKGQKKKTKKAKKVGEVKKTKKELKQEKAEAKRKLRLAKVAICQDLPDWGDRTDVPLMKLPAEILDRCFGTCQDLEMRDWLSLAGVNRYFRHYLNDPFFWDVWFLSSTRDFSKEKKEIYSYDSSKSLETSTSNRPEGQVGLRPFTRNVDNWGIDPAISTPTWHDAYNSPDPLSTIKLDRNGKPPHYIPHGPRAEWTKEQYTIYKEEKVRYNTEERKRRVIQAKQAALDAGICRAASAVNIDGYRRRDGTMMERMILARVRGRADGEEPLKRYVEDVDDARMNVGEDEVGSAVTTEDAPDPRARLDRQLGPEANALWEAAKVPRWLRDPPKPWICPETDGEDDLEPDPFPKYDDKGKIMPIDHWPSKWRNLVATEVNDTWTSEFEARNGHELSDTALICLRHVYVRGRGRTRFFLAAAVEALRYRVHGGYTKYQAKIAEDERLRLEEEERILEQLEKEEMERQAQHRIEGNRKQSHFGVKREESSESRCQCYGGTECWSDSDGEEDNVYMC